MTPDPSTLGHVGRTSAALGTVSPATVRIIPTVASHTATAAPSLPAPPSVSAPSSPTSAAPAPVRAAAVPDPRPSGAAAYFGLFRPCGCGHSSAWHNGAFGEAWRAGEQVRGRCEAAGEDSVPCRCSQFHDLAG
jgi:hypothetical protein